MYDLLSTFAKIIMHLAGWFRERPDSLVPYGVGAPDLARETKKSLLHKLGQCLKHPDWHLPIESRDFHGRTCAGRQDTSQNHRFGNG